MGSIEFSDDWESKLIEAATPGIEKMWWDFCARMRGQTREAIRVALREEWNMSPGDELVGMLARGDRVEPRVRK
jgi:hypothetical protein